MLTDQAEKNKHKVHCTFCPSKMLNAGAARLVNIEVITCFIYEELL